MKNLKYILFFILLISCGAKKKQSNKEIDLSTSLKSNEILKSSKDTLSFKKWSWIQKINFKLSAEDPTQPSTIQYDEETNTINYQNAIIEGNEENEVNEEQNSEGKEITSEENTKDKATNLTSDEAQSESREQWKLKVWHLAPFLLVVGLAYLIINHRRIIFNFLKNKFLKLFNL